jgi:hypothetical protein
LDEIKVKDWVSVVALPEEAQRALLRTGDSAERVWAMWALALRLGANEADELRAILPSEPSAGIRAHLVVVLAGLGEHQLVHTIAVQDPDSFVRAVACQYVIRAAPFGSPGPLEFALQKLRSDVPRVKQAIIDEAESGRLSLPEATMTALLEDGDVDTRRSALTAVRALPVLSDVIRRAVVDRTMTEPDSTLRADSISFCIQAGQHQALVRRASTALCDAAVGALAALDRAGLAVSSVDLQYFDNRDEPRLLLALVEFIAKPLDNVAIRWMSVRTMGAETHRRQEDDQLHEAEVLQWRTKSLFYDAMTRDSNVICVLSPSALEGMLEFVRSFDEDEYDQPNPEERSHLIAVLEGALKAGGGLTRR